MIGKGRMRSSDERTRCLAVLGLFAITWLPPSLGFAFCPQPPAKVCAEYFHRDLVVVGTVESQREVPDEEPGFVKGWAYRLRVRKVFKGPTVETVEIFTENASARFPLTVGGDYLLFASRRDGAWAIDSCSLSQPLSEAQEIIRELERVMKTTGGAIDGRVVRRSSWSGLAGVSVSAVCAGREYKATSDRNGWFHVDVRPGHCKVILDSPTIMASDVSFDDPNGFDVAPGGCGLVQFVAENE